MWFLLKAVIEFPVKLGSLVCHHHPLPWTSSHDPRDERSLWPCLFHLNAVVDTWIISFTPRKHQWSIKGLSFLSLRTLFPACALCFIFLNDPFSLQMLRTTTQCDGLKFKAITCRLLAPSYAICFSWIATLLYCWTRTSFMSVFTIKWIA